MIKWIFFATSHGKSPCDRICGSVKHHAAKRSLQRPMNSQILEYQATLNICEEEMSEIKLFGIVKQAIVGVRKSLVEWFSRGKIPLSSPKISHKLLSEDKSHADTHDFNLPATFQLCDIRPMTCVTCLYDSFWWVGLVTQVDVKVQFMFPHGPCKTFNWPETEDSCYVPIKNILCQISSPTTTTG